ncbi:MAG: hypothetical protein ACKPBV_10850 [Sphaerospermopsis kisseleviana]
MIDFWECGGVRSLLGCEGRSLFGDVGKGDRCFGMMECDRFLWMWEAIAFGMMECDRFWDDGVRSLFVDVRGDRFWECGGAIAFLGMWEAIAVLGMWRGVSGSLP